MISFAALAEPTRFQIVEMLAQQGRMPVGSISRRFKSSAPAISQHLKVLKEARLVNVEVQAQQRIYFLNPEGIKEIDNWLGKIKKQWEARFDALDALVMKNQNSKKE